MKDLKVKLKIVTDEFEKGLKNTKKQTEAWNKGMTSAMNGAKTAIKGATVAIGALGSGMTALVGYGMSATSEITKFSQVTGTTTDEFQRWDSVMKTVGYSMEQANGDFAALGEKALDCANGVGEGAELFGALGVSVTDTSGKMKSQGEIFNETITALQGMEDVTKRNAIASALLGTTGEELVPILNMTTEELANMKANANVISEDDLAKANDFKKKWDDIKQTFNNVFIELSTQLMPIFGEILSWVQSNMPAIKDGIQTVVDVFTGMVDIAKQLPQWLQENEQKLVLLGIALGTVATAIGIYTLAMNWATIATGIATTAGVAFGAVMAFITSPITITIAIIGALVAGIYLLATNWDMISAKTKEVWEFIKTWVVEKVTSIKDGMIDGFNKAKEKVFSTFDNIKNGIKEKIDWAKDQVNKAIEKIKGFFKFEWSLPKLKMPHFSVKGDFSLNPISIPKFSVDWYSEGGIFTKRSILGNGVGVGDGHKGNGNGMEAVLPLDKLPSLLGLDKQQEQPTTVQINIDGREFMRATAKHQGEYSKYNNRKPSFN